jgi:hypothetical protein
LVVMPKSFAAATLVVSAAMPNVSAALRFEQAL